MAQRFVLAVCGYRRSGKDTICNYISTHYQFAHLKFATPLKDMIKAGFGFSDEQLEGDAKDLIDSNLGVSPRTVMQFIGTEVMQFQIQNIIPGIGRSFWTKRLCDSIKLHIGNNTSVVISDLRFLHEYDAIKSLCSSLSCELKVIRVERPSLQIQDQHISELEWIQIPHDVTIINDTDVTNIHQQTDMFFNILKKSAEIQINNNNNNNK